LRLQVEAAMIFNGHTQESIAALDDVTMLQIQTMYADGLIGNRRIIELLGVLTSGVFNYMRGEGQTAYKLANIIGSSYDYLFPPMSAEEQKKSVNNSLLAFMTQSPGYKKGRLKGT
jgi:hypothetical protein